MASIRRSNCDLNDVNGPSRLLRRVRRAHPGGGLGHRSEAESLVDRKAELGARVATGDEVEVDVELDVEPRVVVEPADFARALNADPAARAAYDGLAYSHKREHVLAIERAKKPETRARRIETAVAMLRARASGGPQDPTPNP